MSRLVTIVVACCLFGTTLAANLTSGRWERTAKELQRQVTVAQAQTQQALGIAKQFRDLNTECIQGSDELRNGLKRSTEVLRIVTARCSR
jgi:hypothetical protein